LALSAAQIREGVSMFDPRQKFACAGRWGKRNPFCSVKISNCGDQLKPKPRMSKAPPAFCQNPDCESAFLKSPFLIVEKIIYF
jgi:hypothetical protein